MKLKINGNYYELHFGIKFINNLDHALGATVKGQKLDLGGIQNAVGGLTTSDPAVLEKIIYSAIDGAVSEDVLLDYLDGLTEAELDKLFVDVAKELQDSTAANFQIKRVTGQTLKEVIKIEPTANAKSTKSKK